jgi:hypothetical protein
MLTAVINKCNMAQTWWKFTSYSNRVQNICSKLVVNSPTVLIWRTGLNSLYSSTDLELIRIKPGERERGWRWMFYSFYSSSLQVVQHIHWHFIGQSSVT